MDDLRTVFICVLCKTCLGLQICYHTGGSEVVGQVGRHEEEMNRSHFRETVYRQDTPIRQVWMIYKRGILEDIGLEVDTTSAADRSVQPEVRVRTGPYLLSDLTVSPLVLSGCLFYMPCPIKKMRSVFYGATLMKRTVFISFRIRRRGLGLYIYRRPLVSQVTGVQ